jgi:hypothetical protein
MLFHKWIGVRASCGTEEKNFVELRAGNMQYVFYVGYGGKEEAICSNTEWVSKLGNCNLRMYKLKPRRKHKVTWYLGCPATVSCVGLRKYGFCDTIERIKGKNGVNNKVVHTGPLTEEVKMHPIVSPTVFILSYPCITTLCCVTEILYAVNKGLIKSLNVFLIIFFLFRDSLLVQPIFVPNLYHDSHSLLSSHKLLQKKRANSKCITACSCFAMYNFFYVST